MIVWLFFFFKQKTAYEMRISDWSSDVCSSDLPHGVAELVVIDVRRVTALIADQKNTVVQTFRMGVGDIGVGTFHPPRQIDADEQVQDPIDAVRRHPTPFRSEEHTSELQSLMRISYAVS